MLGKLFKYEMKACARLLLPLYLVLITLSIMDRIILGLNFFKGALAVLPVTITVLFILANVAIAVIASVIIIFRFYKNMVTDEGYLMFTLPVKPYQLINAKLIAGSLWIFISIIVIIAALLLDFGTLSRADLFWDGVKQFWIEYKGVFGNKGFILILETIIALIIGIPSGILQVYASIAIGQLFSGHKILGSVVSYVVLNTMLQIITTIIMVVAGLTIGNDIDDYNALVYLIMPISIVIVLAFTTGFYLITNFIFKKKLNLE